MSDHKLTRRQALQGVGALALAAACAPAATPAAPTAAGTAAPTAARTAAATAAATQRAVVPFKWLFGFTIQANPSLPVIVAKELGLYKEQGLDVSWEFTTDATGIRLIGTGQFQAGSVSDVLSIANFVKEGLPLKAIVQQGQDTARAFAVKKGSGIKRPKDFEGKKVGIKVSPWTEYLSMLALDKADRKKITEVPVGFSSVELKNDIVDVLPVFVGNEPFTLKNDLKVDFDLLHPKDFGAPLIGTTMVVNTKWLNENRDAMVRFLKATMKGQEFFIAEREKTIQMAVQYGGTATTRVRHEFIYDISREDMKHPKGVGFLDKARWQKNIDILADLGLLNPKPKVEDLVDTSFIESILKDGKVVYP